MIACSLLLILPILVNSFWKQKHAQYFQTGWITMCLRIHRKHLDNPALKVLYTSCVLAMVLHFMNFVFIQGVPLILLFKRYLLASQKFSALLIMYLQIQLEQLHAIFFQYQYKHTQQKSMKYMYYSCLKLHFSIFRVYFTTL